MTPALPAASRRTRVLLALEDGEYRLVSIAAWTDLSHQQVRADLKWLQANGLASAGESQGVDGYWYPRWEITDAGCAFLASLSGEEKDW